MGYYKKLKKKAADRWGRGYASSYWLDDYERSFDRTYDYADWGYDTHVAKRMESTHNLYKLASVRRAISNFVQIVTGRNIPVTYSQKGDSSTDGTRVILSADVDDKFDVSVGLALHEASHIVLSNFAMLGDLRAAYSHYACRSTASDRDSFFVGHVRKNLTPEQMRDIFMSTGKIGSRAELTSELFEMLLALNNWIEDRRIDSYIYSTAPGYRGYYLSMYDHYFNDPLVTKAIVSDVFTDEDLDSYFFRIINIMNDKTDLSKLKGLREIHSLLNIRRIDRLKSSSDSLNLAIDVLELMLRYSNNSNSINTPMGAGSAGDGEDDDSDPIEIDDIDGMDISYGDAAGTGSGGSGGKPVKVQLSEKAMKQLKKKIENQKNFLNSKVKKKSITKGEADKLQSIEESGAEMQRVGSDVESGRGSRVTTGVDCIVVKKLTDTMMADGSTPCVFLNSDGTLRERYRKDVDKGIMLGIQLGKKLQIRAESRETVFSRLKSGKIDKRMISSLGYENDSVFFTHEIDHYKKVNLHISLDYSGSMQGDKIRKAVTSTVSIVKACQMARNINVQVSVRTTNGSDGHGLPWICMVYDSRKDSFKDFTKRMSCLHPVGVTPEGLCFEAIQKYLIPQSPDMDSYFLNFSDGQPAFEAPSKTGDTVSYYGEPAADHTFRQVKRMREAGIQVLSYFITEHSSVNFEKSADWVIFKKSYGTGAANINVENIMQVARSMNEMFLKK